MMCVLSLMMFSFFFYISESRSCNKHKKNLCLYFNIRKSITNLTFTKAVLWLPRYDKKLSIRQLHGRQSRKLRPLFPRRKNWLRFDILSFVNDWLNQGRQTQGIEVFRPNDNRMLRMHKEGKDPFIVLNIRSRQKRRINKRPPRKCTDNESSCCLANLTVNFADIGYNEFILNPSYIRVNYCKGDCGKYIYLLLSYSISSISFYPFFDLFISSVPHLYQFVLKTGIYRLSLHWAND